MYMNNEISGFTFFFCLLRTGSFVGVGFKLFIFGVLLGSFFGEGLLVYS